MVAVVEVEECFGQGGVCGLWGLGGAEVVEDGAEGCVMVGGVAEQGE